jgi:hypothetical protein
VNDLQSSAGTIRFTCGRAGMESVVDDREARTYSTPPEAAPSASEATAARERVGAGLSTLFGSVFVAFVVVAIAVLAVRYLF